MDSFNERLQKHVRNHVPSCIAAFQASPSHSEEGNGWVKWSLACSCGSKHGKVLGYPLKDYNPGYDGPVTFVSPLGFSCISCGETTEIIDTKLHGYESECAKDLGHDSSDATIRGTGERKIFSCPNCGTVDFSITASCSHSHFDLIEDCPELEPRAQEYFDAFDCTGKCTSCGQQTMIANFELA